MNRNHCIFLGVYLLVTGLFADAYAQDYQRGNAMSYATHLHGRTTASGEVYDCREYTAAHSSLPFGTMVSVLNLQNGFSTKVRINDRLPRTSNIISLSAAAANQVAMGQGATAPVEVAVVGKQGGPLKKLGSLFTRQKEVPTSGAVGVKKPSFTKPSSSSSSYVPYTQTSIKSYSRKSGPPAPARPVPVASVPNTAPAKPVTEKEYAHYVPYQTSGATALEQQYTFKGAPQAKSAPPVIASSPASRVTPPPAYSSEFGSYSRRVQFGAFSNYSNASRTADALKANGVPAVVSSPDQRGNYRVISQQVFANEAEANNWVGGYMQRFSGEPPIVVR